MPSPAVPPKTKPVITSIRAPADLVEEIDRVATEEGYSRNEIMLFLLRAGLKVHNQGKGKGGH